MVGQCRLDLREVLQREGFGADAGVETRSLDGGDDALLGAGKAAGDGVGGGLAALAEGGADDLLFFALFS